MLMHLQAQGELQRTDRPLDLAFDGEGLLLVRDKSGTLGGARTGTFQLTKEGLIQDAQGLTLQGWPLLPEDGAASAAVQSAPSPSAAFIGPLGALEDIQLIKPEPAPPPKVSAPPPLEEPAPLPAEPPPFYGIGLTMQKEADGLYSLHSSATYTDNSSKGEFLMQRTLTDSLGQERTVTFRVIQERRYIFVRLESPDLSGAATCSSYRDGTLSTPNGCTFDEATKQMAVTFSDTGAKLRLDMSDYEVSEVAYPEIAPGDTLPWSLHAMVFEEGTSKVTQSVEAHFYPDNAPPTWYYLAAYLAVERNGDGVLTGQLKVGWGGSYNLAEVYFDEEGWVSGYKFTSDYNGEDVGIEHAGSFVKDMHFVSGGTDRGTFNIDLSSVRIIDKTKPPKEEVIPEEAREEIPAEPLEEEVPEEIKVEFAPLSPASLSIDENGILRRLKDDGDWEPVYLLACGQFAAMNAAEERNGVYYATPASGVLRTGVSGQNGMGTIVAGTLERSTTDLAHELSEMIRAQHAYAANAKVLSTLDDMLEELERL